jgi:hypothetical protein
MTQEDFRDFLRALDDTGVVNVAGADDGRATPAARVDFLVEEDGPGSPSSTNMAKVIEVLERWDVPRTIESEDRVVAQPRAHDHAGVMLVFARPDQAPMR